MPFKRRATCDQFQRITWKPWSSFDPLQPSCSFPCISMHNAFTTVPSRRPPTTEHPRRRVRRVRRRRVQCEAGRGVVRAGSWQWTGIEEVLGLSSILEVVDGLNCVSLSQSLNCYSASSLPSASVPPVTDTCDVGSVLSLSRLQRAISSFGWLACSCFLHGTLLFLHQVPMHPTPKWPMWPRDSERFGVVRTCGRVQ